MSIPPSPLPEGVKGQISTFCVGVAVFTEVVRILVSRFMGISRDFSVVYSLSSC